MTSGTELMSRDASHGARSADSDVLAMLGKDAVEPEFDEIEDAPDEEEWAEDEEDFEHAVDPDDHGSLEYTVDSDSGRILQILAWSFGGAGIGLILASVLFREPMQPILEAIDGFYLTPSHLLIFGLIFAAMGAAQRQRKGLYNGGGLDLERIERIEHNLEYLIEHAGTVTGVQPPDSSGHEMGQMFIALQRQDEKLANLTRATKMYGKPLIEISNQVSDLLGKAADADKVVQQLEKSLIAASREMSTSVTEAIESASDVSTPFADQLAEILLASRSAATTVGELKNEQQAQAEELQNQQRKLIEETQTTLAKDIHQRMDEMNKRLDKACDSIEQLATAGGGSGGDQQLDQTLDSIRKELSTMATSMSRIQHAGVAAAPAAPAAPVPAAPAGPAPAGGGGGVKLKKNATGLAQSIAGERKASGTGVLGAIAKLKQMRN